MDMTLLGIISAFITKQLLLKALAAYNNNGDYHDKGINDNDDNRTNGSYRCC